MLEDAGEDVTTMRALARKPNGDCVYLTDGGCSIWHHAPSLCRVFDCRTWYKGFSRRDRKRLLAEGKLDKDVLAAGKARLDTLNSS